MKLAISKDQNKNWCFKKEELEVFKELCKISGKDWKSECQKKIFETTGEMVDVFGIGYEVKEW